MDGTIEAVRLSFPDTAPSYREQCVRDVLGDLFATCCLVDEDVADDDDAESDKDKHDTTPAPTTKKKKEETHSSSDEEPLLEEDRAHYELPDGTVLDMNARPRAVRVPEEIFFGVCAVPTPGAGAARWDAYVSPPPPPPHAAPDKGPAPKRPRIGHPPNFSPLPLHLMAHEALTCVDADARKELLANTLLVGGHSAIPGLERRLAAEIGEATPRNMRCKVLAPRPRERRCATWIGGSVLSSLGSFQQLWLSRAEYEEFGAGLACEMRFP